jgi:hypothetical protein
MAARRRVDGFSEQAGFPYPRPPGYEDAGLLRVRHDIGEESLLLIPARQRPFTHGSQSIHRSVSDRGEALKCENTKPLK